MMAEREVEASDKSNHSQASSSSLDSTSNDCKTPLDLMTSPSFPSSSSNYCSSFAGSNLLHHPQQQQQPQQSQSQVHLQQRQSPSTTFESHANNCSSGNSKKRKSQCDKCKNHLIGTLIKDHKKLCPYKNCECGRCKFTIIRRRITSMNQRKRRQKEPSKDIFDNVHMSSRLKVLDKLTDDLDCMVKNPSNYRLSDELVDKILDLLQSANCEPKMRAVSKQQVNLPANRSIDSLVSTSLKLTNSCNNSNASGGSHRDTRACDESTSAFVPLKSCPENLVKSSQVFLCSLTREQDERPSVTSMADATRRKSRGEAKRSLSASSPGVIDYTQPSVKENLLNGSLKKSKKEPHRPEDMSRADVTSRLTTSLACRSTSVTSGHTPSPATSPISVGSEGTPHTLLMAAERDSFSDVAQVNRRLSQCNSSRKSESGGPSSNDSASGRASNNSTHSHNSHNSHNSHSIKVSALHSSSAVSPAASPPSSLYLRDANERSSLAQPLVPASAPFVSPHGTFYPYLYSSHPHRFSSYPLVPQASNAFRFASGASALFSPAINPQSHNIEPSTFILQQYHRHLQQLASQMHQTPASTACRISRMDS